MIIGFLAAYAIGAALFAWAAWTTGLRSASGGIWAGLLFPYYWVRLICQAAVSLGDFIKGGSLAAHQNSQNVRPPVSGDVPPATDD